MLVAAVCAGLVCAACTETGGAQPGRTAAPAVAVPAAAHLGRPTVLARHLAVPWAIAFLPDGDALVTERDSARLLRVTPGGQVAVVGTVPGVAPYGEGGLLGVAVSPSFRQDRLVYLYLSTGTDNRIVRFHYSGGRIGPLQAVLTGIPRAAIHNGGRLAFGPDGMLWASTGEHGQPMLAQDPNSLGGKILRMTPAGRPAPGNPFGTLVWSYGHRNVEGLAWDGACAIRHRTRPGPPGRGQPDREGAQLRLAGHRGGRRARPLHRSWRHLATGPGVARGRCDQRRQSVGGQPPRRAAVADPARSRRSAGCSRRACHRGIRPPPRGGARAGRIAVVHDQQPGWPRPAAARR